jgi:DNA-binding transcriptional ArsR family regulator
MRIYLKKALYSLTGIFLSGYIIAMNTTTLSALAEPSRLRIVELLRDQPRPVGEIAERLSMRQPQVSKHLRVLSEAGLVRARPVAQQRIYQLQPKPFQELDSWVDTFRQLWEERLDTLDDYMQELKKQGKK